MANINKIQVNGSVYDVGTNVYKDAGVSQQRFIELLDRDFYIPTLPSPPTADTLTYVDTDASQCRFSIGQQCRVADPNSDKGYTFYQLYAIDNLGKAVWEKLGGGKDPGIVVEDYRVSDIVQKFIEQMNAQQDNPSISLKISQEDYNTLSDILANKTARTLYFPASYGLKHVLQQPILLLVLCEEGVFDSGVFTQSIAIELIFNTMFDINCIESVDRKCVFNILNNLSVVKKKLDTSTITDGNQFVQKVEQTIDNNWTTRFSLWHEFSPYWDQETVTYAGYEVNARSYAPNGSFQRNRKFVANADNTGIKLAISSIDRLNEFRKEIHLLTNGTGNHALTDNGTYQEIQKPVYLPPEIPLLSDTSTSDEIFNTFGGKSKLDEMVQKLMSREYSLRVFAGEKPFFTSTSASYTIQWTDNLNYALIIGLNLAHESMDIIYNIYVINGTASVKVNQNRPTYAPQEEGIYVYSGHHQVKRFIPLTEGFKQTCVYPLDYQLVELTNSSLSDDISKAVGGINGMDRIISAMKANQILVIPMDVNGRNGHLKGQLQVTSYMYREDPTGDKAIWLYLMGYGVANSIMGGAINIIFTKATNSFSVENIGISIQVP